MTQESDKEEPKEDAVEVPITGELDLHHFRPRELGVLLPEYLRECRKRGILEVRIVHGKGAGTLREGVHRLLERLHCVVGRRPGDSASGSWGATLATLRPWGSCPEDDEEPAAP